MGRELLSADVYSSAVLDLPPTAPLETQADVRIPRLPPELIFVPDLYDEANFLTDVRMKIYGLEPRAPIDVSDTYVEMTQSKLQSYERIRQYWAITPHEVNDQWDDVSQLLTAIESFQTIDFEYPTTPEEFEQVRFQFEQLQQAYKVMVTTPLSRNMFLHAHDETGWIRDRQRDPQPPKGSKLRNVSTYSSRQINELIPLVSMEGIGESKAYLLLENLWYAIPNLRGRGDSGMLQAYVNSPSQVARLIGTTPDALPPRIAEMLRLINMSWAA